MPAALNIKLDGPDLPEGWRGSPQALLEFIKENFRSVVEYGEGVLVGQQNTTEPTVDVGLFVNGRNLLVWDEAQGRYVSAGGIPIGSILSWAGAASLNDPENYLLCDGRTLDRTNADYKQLYDILGFTWGKSGDNGFKIPNLLGRYVCHSGVGDYVLNSDRVGTGTIFERVMATYFGFEWPDIGHAKYPGCPTKVSSWTKQDGTPILAAANNTYAATTPPSLVCRGLIRYK